MKHFLSRVDDFVVIASIALLAGCTRPPAPVASPPPGTGPGVQRANPASRNCVQQGGTLTIERGPGGGQYGVCGFPDNHL
jgi:putative hemolysin